MEYYTNQEARKVLGNIRAKKLMRYVESGILKRYVPPGQRKGLYAKNEVDSLAKEIREFYEGKKEENGEDGRIRVLDSA